MAADTLPVSSQRLMSVPKHTRTGSRRLRAIPAGGTARLAARRGWRRVTRLPWLLASGAAVDPRRAATNSRVLTWRRTSRGQPVAAVRSRDGGAYKIAAVQACRRRAGMLTGVAVRFVLAAQPYGRQSC